jgi:hypothetical protein
MKQWHVPQLITLVRTKSPESILTACKRAYFKEGPYNTNVDCQQSTGEEECPACSVDAAS